MVLIYSFWARYVNVLALFWDEIRIVKLTWDHMYLHSLKHLESVSLGINLFSVEVSISYFKA